MDFQVRAGAQSNTRRRGERPRGKECQYGRPSHNMGLVKLKLESTSDLESTPSLPRTQKDFIFYIVYMHRKLRRQLFQCHWSHVKTPNSMGIIETSGCPKFVKMMHLLCILGRWPVYHIGDHQGHCPGLCIFSKTFYNSWVSLAQSLGYVGTSKTS